MKQHKWLRLVLLFSVIAVIGASIPFTLSFVFDRSEKLQNTFVPPGGLNEQTAVVITVDKNVTNLGSEKIGPEGFVFILENTATGEKQTLTSDVNGYAVFEIPYTGLDTGKTYHYTLHEQNDHRTGVTYSDIVYTIDVTLAMVNDKPVATVLLNGVETANCTAVFENVYKVEETPVTGDPAQLALMLCLMFASASAMIILVRKLRTR